MGRIGPVRDLKSVMRFPFRFGQVRPGALDRLKWLAVPAVLGFLLSGCGTLDYYAQLAQGQLSLLNARRPTADVVTSADTPPVLREHLLHAEAARNFASRHLALPENGSYRRYAELGRPFVVWNVFATPALSLTPITHCFPVAGCVAYRGYYRQGAARGAAAVMKAQGLDVYVGGVEAYSTLGWFDDPILSSMVGWGDARLAATIFHELAHQRFYVKDDTAFNESYATFVEREGSRQWRQAQGMAPEDDSAALLQEQFTALVLATRVRLQAVYAAPLSDAEKQRAKAAQFERLRHDYQALRDTQWHGDRRYDAWVYGPLNNAKLLPFGLYDQWVPSFAQLFQDVGGNWARFYQQVERLGRLPSAHRQQALQALLARQAKPAKTPVASGTD